jgi:hypothetical protein
MIAVTAEQLEVLFSIGTTQASGDRMIERCLIFPVVGELKVVGDLTTEGITTAWIFAPFG